MKVYMGSVNEDQLRQALQLKKQMIDGKSPQRLLKILRQLKNEQHCRFRPARQEDGIQYFYWANDSITRKQSFNSRPIEISQHLKWFRQKMKAPDCRLYIMEYKGKPAGQIRFDIDKGKAMISYSLDKRYRGLGLSGVLLKGGIRQLKKDEPQMKSVEGLVKPGNQPSINAFKKLGFIQKTLSPEEIQFSQII